jgi:hypothetical protein
MRESTSLWRLKTFLKVLPVTMTPGGIIALEEPRISAWSLRLLSAELVREAHGTPAAQVHS